MKKVIVGMSGGVDSAVTAYLLKNAGYEVVGVTLRTWQSREGEESRCCEISDAAAVCRMLGIPHYAWNCLSLFREEVTEPFVREYLAGRTPGPCIRCNRYVKWEKMLYLTKVLKADCIATGHYASVVLLDNGRYTVRQARHVKKDQTYMLSGLSQDQLKATLMPLGNYTKEEVRAIAKQAALPVAEKADSQELCFVPEGSYSDFIEANAGTAALPEGFFLDREGNRLGKHKGIIHYTVGQRKGLGLSLGTPVYVTRIRPEDNAVIVGPEEDLYQKEIFCAQLNWMGIDDLPKGQQLHCRVKVRYQHPAAEAQIEKEGPDVLRIRFRDPVRAAAPGQSTVFYDEDSCVIGSGIIC